MRWRWPRWGARCSLHWRQRWLHKRRSIRPPAMLPAQCGQEVLRFIVLRRVRVLGAHPSLGKIEIQEVPKG